MVHNEILYIVTAISNPISWQSRIQLAKDSINDWLKEPNVRVVIVECSHFGDHFELGDLEVDPRVTLIKTHATTMAWSKENLINIGISRLPREARYIATFDADIFFRKNGWATETIKALHLYPVVQPWKTAYDLGPNDDLIQIHRSFAHLYHSGQPVVSESKKWWKFQGGAYEYAHTGYAWAYRREFLDEVGGLMEFCGMGSADYHMAVSLIGKFEKTLPCDVNNIYAQLIKSWQARSLAAANMKIGYTHQTIEHRWHGKKADRKYNERWEMFIEHDFNPLFDLKRNSYGVLEWAGNKPELERKFDNYLRSRNEDGNIM